MSRRKKVIISTSIGIAAIAGGILNGKNWDTLCELAVELSKSRSRNNLLLQAQDTIGVEAIEVDSQCVFRASDQAEKLAKMNEN